MKNKMLLTLLSCLLLSCGDYGFSDTDEVVSFTLPSALDISPESTAEETLVMAIQSSQETYAGMLGVVNAIFQDANVQAHYIMCSSFRIHQLSKRDYNEQALNMTLAKIIKRQSFVVMEEAANQISFLTIPNSTAYRSSEQWKLKTTPVLQYNPDETLWCREDFYRAIPNSKEARVYEEKALAQHIVLAIRRLKSLKKSLVKVEFLASHYSAFETTLRKIKSDVDNGLSNPLGVKEKVEAYNLFLKSPLNSLPASNDKMTIESGVTSKEGKAILKLF
ncbi:MAG: hypothetical protein Q9M28_00180 [Mariprofundaceae bacterium]|nr:hypothetical protein [Mariprofundaceae bacterium]